MSDIDKEKSKENENGLEQEKSGQKKKDLSDKLKKKLEKLKKDDPNIYPVF